MFKLYVLNRLLVYLYYIEIWFVINFIKKLLFGNLNGFKILYFNKYFSI